MEWLHTLYPKVQTRLEAAIPSDWPSLKRALAEYTDGPVIPEGLLPLAACQAVGGDPEEAVPVAAAVLAAAACLRIADDVFDQDRPGRLWDQVGPAQAGNYALATQALAFKIVRQAPLTSEALNEIEGLFVDTFLLVTYGQERDLIKATQTIESYWQTIEHKIAYAYAAACAAGALVGTRDTELVQACGAFGHHLGLALQVLNDIDSIWSSEGGADVRQGKVTLPLLYGLTTEHPERGELEALLGAPALAAQEARVREILDHIDTRGFVTWAALRERDHALDALKRCPGSAGREALAAYITGLFEDIAEVAPPQT